MKEIPLTQGLVTQVDDDIYDHLMQWKWYAHKDYRSNIYYAERKSNLKDESKGKRYIIRMQNVIMPPTPGTTNDHEDRNGLNNQRYNLRRATDSQNKINRIYKNKSGYRGVYYNERMKKWQAYTIINGKQKHLGYFDDPIIAAQVHDTTALKYQGEFAITNFKH